MMESCRDTAAQTKETREVGQELGGFIALNFPVLDWLFTQVCNVLC
jgi:hypothetical protein